jgi:hypothetical protein
VSLPLLRACCGGRAGDVGLLSFMAGLSLAERALQETRLPGLGEFGDVILVLTPAQAACGHDRGST